MTFLTKAQMLSAQRRQTVEVDASELGGKLRVRFLSAAAADRFATLQAQLKKGQVKQPDVFAELLLETCVDDENLPLFTSREDAKQALEAISLDLVLKVLNVVLPKSAAHSVATPKLPINNDPTEATWGQDPSGAGKAPALDELDAPDESGNA